MLDRSILIKWTNPHAAQELSHKRGELSWLAFPRSQPSPNKGNADGAVGIFGNSGRVWATVLRPVPPKKRPCAILARKVGRSTNTPRSQPSPNKGNADGAVGIFGKCRARVGYGPAPGPTIKRPFATLTRKVGRSTNTPRSQPSPNKGNADGAVGIFGKCRARVGYGPAPGPTIKRPFATLARKVGRSTNTPRSQPSLIRGMPTGP